MLKLSRERMHAKPPTGRQDRPKQTSTDINRQTLSHREHNKKVEAGVEEGAAVSSEREQCH